MEATQNQAETKVRVKFSRFVNGEMKLQEQTIFRSDLQTFTEDLERQGGKVHRADDIKIKPVQLFWKEQGKNAVQMLDCGGEFILKHYIGKDAPIELALGLDAATATESYNEYMEKNNLPEFIEDDLSFYCGHTYSYRAG